MLSGESWSQVVDTLTGVPFWYNDDTGAATYGRPAIVEAREDYQTALMRGYIALPLPILTIVMSFLLVSSYFSLLIILLMLICWPINVIESPILTALEHPVYAIDGARQQPSRCFSNGFYL